MRLETKTRRHRAADKSMYRGDKIADQPARARLQGNRAFLLWHRAIECPNEICNRKRARRCKKARRLRLRSKVSPAANPLHSRVAPSIRQKMIALQRVLCGGNCWERICGQPSAQR